ncbi:MAG: 2-oxo acid dehydrogenase subunit E2 [Candidatus Hydrogenedentes bacterium]|nr:2-oxo acid dehydrogenase subunit E2 [Candidatus Hydrogenedentota bacterium]
MSHRDSDGVPMLSDTHVSLFDIQRRVVANKTLEGWRTAPHASIGVDFDVTPLLSFVDELRQRPVALPRVTVNSVLVKIIAEGVKASPEMNAHIDYRPISGVGKLVLHRAINIAVPLRMPDGRTVTPTLQDSGRLSLLEVCVAMEDLKRRTRNTNLDILLREAALRDTWLRLRGGDWRVLLRLYPNLLGRDRLPRVPRHERRRYRSIPESDRITPENLVSATLLVSNAGTLLQRRHVTIQMLEIIQPQTTAVALGPIVRRPLAVQDREGRERVEVRSVLPMTICIDHRAMDLEHVRGFIDTVEGLCANPWQLLEAHSGNGRAAAVPV